MFLFYFLSEAFLRKRILSFVCLSAEDSRHSTVKKAENYFRRERHSTVGSLSKK